MIIVPTAFDIFYLSKIKLLFRVKANYINHLCTYSRGERGILYYHYEDVARCLAHKRIKPHCYGKL